MLLRLFARLFQFGQHAQDRRALRAKLEGEALIGSEIARGADKARSQLERDLMDCEDEEHE